MSRTYVPPETNKEYASMIDVTWRSPEIAPPIDTPLILDLGDRFVVAEYREDGTYDDADWNFDLRPVRWMLILV